MIDILKPTASCEGFVSCHVPNKDCILAAKFVFEHKLYANSALRLSAIARDGGRLVRTESILDIQSQLLISEIKKLFSLFYSQFALSNTTLVRTAKKNISLVFIGLQDLFTARLCGGEDKLIDLTIAIDKLDKIGWEKVKEELTHKGFDAAQQSVVESYLNIDGNNEEKIKQLALLLGDNENGKKGIEELQYVLSYHQSTGMNKHLVADFTLARGLNYYTGLIFEVKAIDTQMGSIGGGGRYNDLTSLFGVPNIPGVGISFGVDRIYDVLEEKNLFPATIDQGTQVLFFNLGEAEAKVAYTQMMFWALLL